MRQNFTDALAHVLDHEGGYVNHPRDPGGVTNRGITLATFRRFFGRDKMVDDLRNITDTQIRIVYRAGYWDMCRCDSLPSGIDYSVFDAAVHSGPNRAARWLQTAARVRTDGVIGPRTIEAARMAPTIGVLTELYITRLAYLRELGTWRVFGRGWCRRVIEVRDHATKMAPWTFQIVKRGSTGEWVRRLQTELCKVRSIHIDGEFGPETEQALIVYQTARGLTPDGIAGKQTYQAMGFIA